MNELFWSVFGLGLVFFASPGPINIETVRRGVNGGPWPAFSLQVGAIVAECAVGVAVLFGVAPLMQLDSVQLAFTLGSAAILLWIGWGALREARRTLIEQPNIPTARHSLLVGVICAASSPLTAVMWLAIAGIAAGSLAALSLTEAAIIGSGYLLGALTWAILSAVFLGYVRTLVQPRFWRWWNAASGLLLGGYGLHMLWTVASAFS